MKRKPLSADLVDDWKNAQDTLSNRPEILNKLREYHGIASHGMRKVNQTEPPITYQDDPMGVVVALAFLVIGAVIGISYMLIFGWRLW